MPTKRHPKKGDRYWQSLVSRFREGIRRLENGCWVCDRAEHMSNGYSRLTVNKKPLGRYRVSVHRLSYQVFRGPISKGLCVCHSCDNPACCNPGHLFLGTHAENAHDREAKHRGLSGENHPNAKLTEDQVRGIHRKSASGISQWKIAKQYGLTQAAVSVIVTGKAWPHLCPAPKQRKLPRARKQVKCSVKGCRYLRRTHGMCTTHYRRWSTTGNTDAPIAPDADKSLWQILVGKFAAGIEHEASGCWTCSASDYGHESGYGRVSIVRAGRGGLRFFTHRLSFEHFCGQIPKDKVVCHACDNRRCCNPSHLFLGTQAENLRDMVQKDRSRRGERHHNVKLSESDVREIRRKAGSTSQRELGAKYGVSRTTISDIKHGRRWKHQTAQV